MDKYLGKRLDGRYEIHELIGIGGMANVYRCTDTVDDREVAIKILKDEFLNNDEFIRRFKNESKAIAMLSHPNIVKVYDVSFGDMIQYIVMEYIDGITLKEYIERQGVVEWKDALHLTTQVLRALQHAHESGIVHRDIKPQNIMLLQDGTIKVTDFGIARFSDKATRTMTDQAIGSVHYIAPEQARGDVTDGKTDIYSVGVMLYEMLTGQLPFEGDSAVTVALMQLQSTPKPPREVNPSIPQGLEQITIRAMEKDPEMRYTSAAEMLSDIERFRLNPSIVFDYGTSFVDNQPTKFVETDAPDANNGESEQAKPDEAQNEADKKQEKDLKENARRTASDKKKKGKDQENEFGETEVKERSNRFYAVRGILIAAVAMCVLFAVLAIIMAVSSSRAKDVSMPGFVGRDLAEVKENNPENFQFDIKSKYDSSQPLGVVLSQDPAANMIVKSGSVVSLTVNSNNDEITVPFFNSSSKGKEVADKLKELSLVPEVVMVNDASIGKDYVLGTFPAAGAKAPIGSTVYIYTANGEQTDTVEIPKVIGLSVDEARAALEEAGLTVETVNDDESTEKKDTVVSASPLQGGKVKKGTPVKLTVSSGVGDKSKVTLNIDLPTGGLDHDAEMIITINGEVDSERSKTIPAYTTSIQIELEGTGTKNVVVQIDGQVYREYNIDFKKGKVDTVTHDFVPLTTAAPVTEAPTEYVEPVTEYVEPSLYETEPPVVYDDSTLLYDGI